MQVARDDEINVTGLVAGLLKLIQCRIQLFVGQQLAVDPVIRGKGAVDIAA